ncbi:MAG: hypothetical protein ABEJ46_04220, partial [Gemmatimonadota bacterium]
MSDTSPPHSDRGRATAPPRPRWPLALATAAAALLWLAPGARAQQTDVERTPAAVDTAAREIAGLRMGTWAVTGL